MGPFLAPLSIVLYYYLKRKTQKNLVLCMKTETFNAINNSHKKCFLEVFIMIPLWALVHYGPLCALRALLAPWCGVQKICLSLESSP